MREVALDVSARSYDFHGNRFVSADMDDIGARDLGWEASVGEL